MPFLIEMLKELYPKINLNDYKVLQKIAENEFGVRYPLSSFEAHFSPSIEGLEDEYKYKLKMFE